MPIRRNNSGADSRTHLSNLEHPHNLYANMADLKKQVNPGFGGVFGGGDPNLINSMSNPIPLIVSATPSYAFIAGHWTLAVNVQIAYEPPEDFIQLEAEIYNTDGQPGYSRFVQHGPPVFTGMLWQIACDGAILGGTYAVHIRAYVRRYSIPGRWSQDFTGIFFDETLARPDPPTAFHINTAIPINGYQYGPNGAVTVNFAFTLPPTNPDHYDLAIWETSNPDGTMVVRSYPYTVGGIAYTPVRVGVQYNAALYAVSEFRSDPANLPGPFTVPGPTPAPPTSLAVDTSYGAGGYIYGSPFIATTRLQWTRPGVLPDQFILEVWQTTFPPNGPSARVRRFIVPATENTCLVDSLNVGYSYTAQVYSRNLPNYDSTVTSLGPWLIPAAAPSPPTNLRLDTRDGTPGYGTTQPVDFGVTQQPATGWIHIRFDPPSQLPDQYLFESWYLVGSGVYDYRMTSEPPGSDFVHRANLVVGVQYHYVLTSVYTGQPGATSVPFLWTVTSWALAAVPIAGATFGVDYTNINRGTYSYALGLPSTPSVGTIDIQDQFQAVKAGSWMNWEVDWFATTAEGTATYSVWFYDNTSTPIGGSPTALFAGTPTTGFVTHNGQFQVPANAVRVRKHLVFARPAIAHVTTLYVSEPKFAIANTTMDYSPGSILTAAIAAGQVTDALIAPGVDAAKITGLLTTGSAISISMTNNSGGSVANGDVVIQDNTGPSAFTTTAAVGYNTGWIGVVQESIASGASGRVCIYGYVPRINLSISTSAGTLIRTVSPKLGGGSGLATGAFAVALATGSTPPAIVFNSIPFTQFMLGSNNFSDLTNLPVARNNLGLGGAALLAVGTTAGTVAAGDDSRIVFPVSSMVLKTTAFTADAVNQAYNCFSATGFTVTLPTAVGIAGRIYHFKSNNVGTITIDAAGSETIDNALTFLLAQQYQSITIMSDGTNWQILDMAGTTGLVDGSVTAPKLAPNLSYIGLSWVSKTVAFTVDDTNMFYCCAASAPFTVTLPAAAPRNGRIYIFKNPSPFVITIVPSGTDNIDGQSSYQMTMQNQTVCFLANGAGGGWYLLWQDAPVTAAKLAPTLDYLGLTITTKTANFTIDNTALVYLCNNAISMTATLPTAVGITGRIYLLKNISATGALTVATTSSQTIDGSTTYTMPRRDQTLWVQSDGANWRLLIWDDLHASTLPNRVWVSPSGSTGVPSFRALVSADIPATLGPTNFTGDMTVDASGGTTGTPRILGLTNLGAARLQIGDQWTSLQSAAGDRFQIQAYHGVEIWGGRATTGSTVAFVTGSGGTDPSLSVIGSQAGTAVLVVKESSGHSANAQEWQNNAGTILSSIGASGAFVFGGSQVVSGRKTGWAAPTGTASRATFVTSTVTLPVLAGVVMALYQDLSAHGLIGP